MSLRLSTDPRTPTASVSHTIQDCFRPNQWCRISVSGSGNHLLDVISKWSQSATWVPHCELLLFPVQLHYVTLGNIVANSNNYISVSNDLSARPEDNLISWSVRHLADQTHFASGTGRAFKPDQTGPLHCIFVGHHLGCRAWGRSDARWSQKAPVLTTVMKWMNCSIMYRSLLG